MSDATEDSQEEKLYVVPDRMLEYWEQLSASARSSEARARRAESGELSANVMLGAVVASWAGFAFGAVEGRAHRWDFWMYLLAAQVIYYFVRFAFFCNPAAPP